MLTTIPSRSAVSRSACFKIFADSPGSRSSAPTGWTRQRRVAARSMTIRSITRSSGPSSPASLREKLSVESTHSVTTGMPISSHHSTKSFELVRPGLIAGHQRLTRRVGPGPAPVAVGEHRHVPGQAVLSSSAIRRCSYVAYSSPDGCSRSTNSRSRSSRDMVGS